MSNNSLESRTGGRIDPQIEARKRYVDNVIQRALVRAGVTIAINCGTGAFLIEENRPKIKEVFRLARDQALQKAGVLDEELNVIPGQEDFAPKK